MIRVSNPNMSYIKTTFRPLYAFAQATPKSMYLDPAWNNAADIYPGSVMMKTVGDQVSLIDGTGVPYGFSSHFLAPGYAGGIDQVTPSGVNAIGCWVLSADAEFEVLAPAFDSALSWVEPTNGTISLVYAHTTGAKRGTLCPAGTSDATSRPVARLLKVASATKIVIGGLVGTQ